jgi:integrase
LPAFEPVEDRLQAGRVAGLPELHAHQLRHTFAHGLAQRGTEADLMRIAEWKSRAMLQGRL